MLIHNQENEHAIIGEAAMSLALAEREISVASLFAELSYMAECGTTPGRLEEISAAIVWLMCYGTSGISVTRIPYEQIRSGLN